MLGAESPSLQWRRCAQQPTAGSVCPSMETHGSLFCHLIVVFVMILSHYRSITKYLVPSTWYPVLGSKFLVPSTSYQAPGTNYDYVRFPNFTIWPDPNNSFERFELFCVIGSAENDRSHTEISFHICCWGSWVMVTSQLTRHLNVASGIFRSKNLLNTPRIQEPWQVQFLEVRRISKKWISWNPTISPILVGPYRTLYISQGLIRSPLPPPPIVWVWAPAPLWDVV